MKFNTNIFGSQAARWAFPTRVEATPLKSITYLSVGIMTFPNMESHKIHVPNHQPVSHIWSELSHLPDLPVENGLQPIFICVWKSDPNRHVLLLIPLVDGVVSFGFSIEAIFW